MVKDTDQARMATAGAQYEITIRLIKPCRFLTEGFKGSRHI